MRYNVRGNIDHVMSYDYSSLSSNSPFYSICESKREALKVASQALKQDYEVTISKEGSK